MQAWRVWDGVSFPRLAAGAGPTSCCPRPRRPHGGAAGQLQPLPEGGGSGSGREWDAVAVGEVEGTARLQEQIDFFCILPTASPGGIRSARTRPRRWLRSFSAPAVGSSSAWGRPSHLAAPSSTPSGVPVAGLDPQRLWSSRDLLNHVGACPHGE